ncbi:hypothetical protein AVEN_99815-1 [Araneus ventricosus]|uniref:Uncharacterized protein n=1 Tax=Araneus ventricosus TaxID=182803 RepID=A0A4Y2UTB8_ARAVE|nr:hypothetical protein AVEN_99815-1 [Araneus ventricosus]
MESGKGPIRCEPSVKGQHPVRASRSTRDRPPYLLSTSYTEDSHVLALRNRVHAINKKDDNVPFASCRNNCSPILHNFPC